MSPEAALLISGLVFGLSGGLTPGPLLALIITQSLRYGPREGIRIAIAKIPRSRLVRQTRTPTLPLAAQGIG